MKAFIDTSSLIKKYVHEKGSDRFDQELKAISEITVAPIYWIELISAVERRKAQRTLPGQAAEYILKEAEKDLEYFNRVIWNELLEIKAVQLIRKHSLRTLDSVQLASGILSKADVFLTSDKNLCHAATQELKTVKLI